MTTGRINQIGTWPMHPLFPCVAAAEKERCFCLDEPSCVSARQSYLQRPVHYAYSFRQNEALPCHR